MINALDFTSEEAYNEAFAEFESEMMGDGYRNEFQRSYANSRNTIPNRDESSKIDVLVAEGKFVVYRLVEISCPITDGMIRVEQRVSSIHDTYVAASEAAHGSNGEFDDMTGIAMAQQPVAITEVPFTFDTELSDEIPF